ANVCGSGGHERARRFRAYERESAVSLLGGYRVLLGDAGSLLGNLVVFVIVAAVFITRGLSLRSETLESNAPVPQVVRAVPHVAFEVDDLAAEIAGKEIIAPPNSPSDGVTVAFSNGHHTTEQQRCPETKSNSTGGGTRMKALFTLLTTAIVLA